MWVLFLILGTDVRNTRSPCLLEVRLHKRASFEHSTQYVKGKSISSTIEINQLQKTNHLLLRRIKRSNRSMTCIHYVQLDEKEPDKELEQTFLFNSSKAGSGLLGPFIKLNCDERYCVHLYWLKQRI